MMISFHVEILAPRKGAIIVGDAVVEIDTGLKNDGSGRVLAMGS